MKHLKYRIISTAAACACFFLVSLSGSFLAIADTQTNNSPLSSGDNAGKTISEGIGITDTATPIPSSAVSQNAPVTVTPRVTPKATPTAAPAPSASPAPTVAPTPSVSPTPTAIPSPTPSPTPEPFVFTKAIAKVTDYVNIREDASTDTPIVGKLFENGIAEVLGAKDNWTHISSGNVTGYIRSDYLYLDEQAIAYADSITAYNAKVKAGSVNVRSGPSTEHDRLGTTYNGDTYPAILSLSNKEWIAVQYTADTVAYLYAEYVTLTCNQKEALTLAEIAAAERAAKIEKAHVKSLPVTYRDPVSVSDEDLEVFALVVAAEAYWEPYDGKLAVANVILNRLLQGKYGDTIYDVVTAPKQFDGYRHIDKYRDRDLTDCYKACREALSGKNNIGDYLFFHADYYVDSIDEWPFFTSWYQIEGHIFFKRNW